MDSLLSFPVGRFHPLQHAGLSRRSPDCRQFGKWTHSDDSTRSHGSTHPLSRPGRFDVVVQAEEVCGVVFVFQGNKAVVIAAVGFACEGVALIGYVVAISSGN